MRISTHVLPFRFLLVIYTLGGAALFTHSARELDAPHRQVWFQDPLSIIARVPQAAAIASDRNGSVYVLSRANNTITKMSSVGSIERVIGPTLEYEYQIRVPQGAFQPLHI